MTTSHSEKPANNLPPNVFLIIEGKRLVPLTQTVTRIGRKSDNDVVLSDQHVSRYHAEIRYVEGDFILVDLKSTAGTSVNGTRIREALLKAGDVISIGGVPLIFGRGKPSTTLGEVNYQTDEGIINTGPTDALDIEEADSYLQWFEDEE